MNAKLLRNLVERHAPDEVKEQLKKLDLLNNAKRDLQRQANELHFEIIHGPRPKHAITCGVCGAELPADPLHRNGHCHPRMAVTQ
jgi:hypothetical protein